LGKDSAYSKSATTISGVSGMIWDCATSALQKIVAALLSKKFSAPANGSALGRVRSSRDSTWGRTFRGFNASARRASACAYFREPADHRLKMNILFPLPGFVAAPRSSFPAEGAFREGRLSSSPGIGRGGVTDPPHPSLPDLAGGDLVPGAPPLRLAPPDRARDQG
jgi:hypothetical protein